MLKHNVKYVLYHLHCTLKGGFLKKLLWLATFLFFFVSACQAQVQEAKTTTLVEIPRPTQMSITATTFVATPVLAPTRIAEPTTQPTPLFEYNFLFRLVDTQHPIGEEEIQKEVISNLVNFHQAWVISQKGIKVLNTDLLVNRLCLEDLIALVSASDDADLDLFIRSGYRSYQGQKMVLEASGGNQLFVLPPGASQHHTGLAIDFTFDKPSHKVGRDFANSSESEWLKEHAIEYGFVMSYVANHDGISDEPWHYIYLGKDLAKKYQEEVLEGTVKDVFEFQALHQPTP